MAQKFKIGDRVILKPEDEFEGSIRSNPSAGYLENLRHYYGQCLIVSEYVESNNREYLHLSDVNGNVVKTINKQKQSVLFFNEDLLNLYNENYSQINDIRNWLGV